MAGYRAASTGQTVRAVLFDTFGTVDTGMVKAVPSPLAAGGAPSTPVGAGVPAAISPDRPARE